MTGPASKSSAVLSPRVWAVAGIPTLLLVVASGLLLGQVFRLEKALRWLEHTEESIALAVKTERNLRAEQAARTRQWLTGKEQGDALAAAADFALSLHDLREHFAHDPAQLDQLRAIEAAYRVWRRYTAQVQVTPDSRFEDHVQTSAALVDDAVEAIRILEREERRLRLERAQHLDDVVSLLTYAALPMLLLLALAISISARREVFRLARDFNEAMEGRQRANRELELQSWVREQLRWLGVSREDAGFRSLGERTLEVLISATNAVVGSVYFANDEWLERCASHGVAVHPPGRVTVGEGLLGEAAKSGKLRHLSAVPADYLRVESSLGSAVAAHLILVPCQYKNEVTAMIELGFMETPSERSMVLLEQAGAVMGMAFAITSKKVRLQSLLAESRRQAEALQLQQEELRVANEELSSQSHALRAAHSQLEARKSELEQSNQELTKQRNALDETRKQLESRAMQLRRADRYKSEFLASMSHELRTPLNSILILSKSLSQADPARLTPDEIRYAETIHASGNDLLAMINDVLELSKIEAGAAELHPTETTVSEIVGLVLRVAEPLARDRGLELAVEIEDPEQQLCTDVRRVQQILKNLLSNACKFTTEGTVTFRARKDGEGVVFEVEDTGLGIAPEHLESIFEAFRQVEGDANRRFGGTGLGLAISRDLARLLGGDVTASSELDRGSCFSVRLPLAPPTEAARRVSSSNPMDDSPRAVTHEPGPAALQGSESPRQLWVLSDEAVFEQVEEAAEQAGFRCLRVSSVPEVLALAAERQPIAIVVDLGAESVTDSDALKVLRDHSRTASVPLHVIGRSEEREEALSLGVVSYLKKPVDASLLRDELRRMKPNLGGVLRVLVVEPDPTHARDLERLLSVSGVYTVVVNTAAEAIAELEAAPVACLVTDLELPDATGQELLRKLSEVPGLTLPSVIVYTARAISEAKEQELMRCSDAIILKGPRSSERLLDEVTLFLHRVNQVSPPGRDPASSRLRAGEQQLLGRRLLLVEDDVRSVFTLTNALERQGAELRVARTGQAALDVLRDGSDVELVLMDLVMPEMDGLEAIRRIRRMPGKTSKLPIIALTGSAGNDGRDACIKAGASDYVPKPIELDRLVSLTRIWLSR